MAKSTDKKAKVLQLLKRNKRDFKCPGHELQVRCPHCPGGGLKFYFNLKKDLGHCFRCEASVYGLESFLRFVVGLQQDHIAEVSKKVSEGGWTQKKRGTLIRLLHTKEREYKLKPAPLPDKRVRVVESALSILGNEIIRYLRLRGFNPDSIQRLDPYVSMLYPNWFILPVRLDDKIVYWIRRTLLNAEPKYMSPDTEKDGRQVYYAKSDVLWGYDLLEKGGECIITEGILSAAAVCQLGHPAVAIFGKTLSIIQRNLLIDKELKQITIALDGRKKGDNTNEKAAKIYSQLRDFVESVQVLTLPPGKDPNDLIGENSWLSTGEKKDPN